MEIPGDSPFYNLPRTIESLSSGDIQTINEWLGNSNTATIAMLVILGVIFSICLYTFKKYASSVAFWIGLVSFAFFCVAGITLLFSSPTAKTLAEKKKKVLVVTVKEKITKMERQNQRREEVYYLYFDKDRAFCKLPKEEWNTYKVGQKIKFHFFIDQNTYFKFENVQ